MHTIQKYNTHNHGNKKKCQLRRKDVDRSHRNNRQRKIYQTPNIVLKRKYNNNTTLSKYICSGNLLIMKTKRKIIKKPHITVIVEIKSMTRREINNS